MAARGVGGELMSHDRLAVFPSSRGHYKPFKSSEIYELETQRSQPECIANTSPYLQLEFDYRPACRSQTLCHAVTWQSFARHAKTLWRLRGFSSRRGSEALRKPNAAILLWFIRMVTAISKETRKNKILVVDDVAVNVQLLTTYLTSVGYNVIAARDGQEALEKVVACNPDLVLLDVMMPKFNGFEVCERIKAEEATRIVPVIMVTALNEIEDKIKATEAGADDFVSKPFNKLELLTRVKSLLRIKELHDQLNAKVKELEEAQERLRQLAITDGLTSLFNHRYFKEHLEQELYRASRQHTEVSLIMIDIDFFKRYNDTFGHPAGDALLRAVARLLKDNIRKIDIAARYGGEEFTLVLADTTKAAASTVAEKMRRMVETNPFEGLPSHNNGHITISLGVATFPIDATNSNDLIAMADQRLYQAKQQGRNLVVAE